MTIRHLALATFALVAIATQPWSTVRPAAAASITAGAQSSEEALAAKLNTARALMDAGQLAKARLLLEEIWRDGSVTSDARAEAGVEAANSLLDGRDYRRAEVYALRSARASEVHDFNGSRDSSYRILGQALLEQKAYDRAAALLRNWGGAEYGVALEALHRDREAEAVWRRLGDARRLSTNLERQGRPGEAAAAMQPVIQQQEAAKEIAKATPPAAFDVAQAADEMAAERRRSAADARARGDAKTAAIRESLAHSEEQLVLASARDYQALAENPDVFTVDPDRARVGRLRFAAGDYTAAADLLAQACPNLRGRALFDIGLPTPTLGETPPVPVDGCYQDLALARYRLAAGGAPDAIAFEAAQGAVDNQAAGALSNAAARRLARLAGAEPILLDIDREVAAIRSLSAPLNKRWGAVDASRMSEAEYAVMMRQLGQSRSAMVPHRDRLDKLQKTLVATAPAFVALKAPQPVPLVDLIERGGRLLKSEEALILWMIPPGGRRGIVFAISPARSGWAEIPLSGDEIGHLVGGLRRQIDPCDYDHDEAACQSGPIAFDRSAAYRLGHALLGDPLIQAVIAAPEVKTLLIVPSGAMTALPPGLLVTRPPSEGKEGDKSSESLQATRWLIRDKALAVLPSVAALRAVRVLLPDAGPKSEAAAQRNGSDLLMLANPAFAGPTDSAAPVCTTRSAPQGIGRYFDAAGGLRAERARLCPLPGTAREADQLGKLLGGLVLTGTDAREGRLRQGDGPIRLRAARIVAFATHGLVSGDLGLGEPALALAAPTSEEAADDGLLTASEIAMLKTDADFVLLSACNTASGDVPEAYGLSGLSRAFLQAGAHSLLVSHWRIDDEAAQTLVAETVRLREILGRSKAEALQSASLAVLDGMVGGISTAHPAYWAPFTLMGEP